MSEYRAEYGAVISRRWLRWHVTGIIRQSWHRPGDAERGNIRRVHIGAYWTLAAAQRRAESWRASNERVAVRGGYRLSCTAASTTQAGRDTAGGE